MSYPRPDDVLLPDEKSRTAEFEALYLDVLRRISGTRNASAMQRMVAQEVAGSIWRMSREGQDAKAAWQEVAKRSTTAYARSRANAASEASSRSTNKSWHLKDIRTWMDLLKVLGREPIHTPQGTQ